MKALLIILFTTILTENYVLVQYLGICPFLGVSKDLSGAVGMSAAVTFVTTMASAVTWCLHRWLLAPYGLDYLSTLLFILVIAALVQLVETVMKKYLKSLHRMLGVYLPLITTNCIVLAATLLNIENEYTFIESIVSSLGAGLGFLIAMVLFCGVRMTLRRAKPPKCFEGLPITLVSAGLTSLSFMGFAGLVDNLFR